MKLFICWVVGVVVGSAIGLYFDSAIVAFLCSYAATMLAYQVAA